MEKGKEKTIGVVLGLVGLAGLAIGGYFVYKKYKGDSENENGSNDLSIAPNDTNKIDIGNQTDKTGGLKPSIILI